MSYHPVIQLKLKHRRTGEWKVILTECPLCASGLPPASNATGVVNVSVGGDNNAETPSAPTARGEGIRKLNNSLDLPLTDNDTEDDDDDSSYISTRSSRSSISYTPRTSSTSSTSRGSIIGTSRSSRYSNYGEEDDDEYSVKSSRSEMLP